MKKTITKLLMLFVLCLVGMQGNAQNVTISPQNGSMICSDATGQGTSGGAFSMWKHEQLSLTMVASGSTELTDEGILKNHRNWFNTCNGCTFRSNVSAADKATYIDCGWQDANGYYTISLPKGYRFTGYKFSLSHDITNTGQGFTTTTSTSVIWAETHSDFSDFGDTDHSVTLPAVPNSANNVQVYELSRTGNDMGNVLYFKATAINDPSGTQYYDLTFRYVELTFTADADTHIDIQPSTAVSTGQSMLEVPFNTGKVDLGEVTQRAIPRYGNRISYSLTNFKDMAANMLLYEAESVHAATGTESYDGTAGDVAYSKAGSITTAGDFFKLTTGTKEQVYYLESPVYATMQNGGKNPIQFRIVGANIEYNNGSSVPYDEFTMSVGNYYLGNGYGRYTSPTNWFLDEEGYVRCGTNGANYLTIASGQATYYTYTYITTTSSKSEAQKFKINGDYLQVDGGTYNNYYVSYGAQANNTTYWRLRGDNTQQPVTITKTGTTSSVHPSVGECTIKVYDKTGQTVVATQTVNSSNTSGSIPLAGLNNDAVKFSVQGTGYVKLSVILQALDPYIDNMTVVMNDTDNGKDIRMTRTFTADDFSVGGDTFRFYLPTDCNNDDLFITFEDLYSNYGDNTYDHTSQIKNGTSRYSYVMSQHHQAYTGDNIYNNTAEAVNDTQETVRLAANNGEGQLVRTKVGTVGDVAFRFNNADELSTHEGYMTEYPFTLNKYATQTNPGNGHFIVAEFKDTETSTEQVATKTFYVFTTDETKYNIAPTTATQHRFYAFYKMIIEIVLDDYDPVVAFEKVYDKTCYGDDHATDAFYGAIVTGPSGIADPLASDEATYEAIVNKIKAGGTNVPTDMKQILYLDMSGLKGVYHSNGTTDDKVEDFNDLRSKLATNALVFLPINSTATFDNFAYAKKGETTNSFQAANNIVLTDKQPFYTPYDIQVDAANYAKYTRILTSSDYGKDIKAMVLLPYALTIAESKHTNPAVADQQEGKNSFWVKEMKSASLVEQTRSHDYGIAYFGDVSGTKTTANKPYMVLVDEGSVEGDVSFVAIEKGATIVATKGNMSQRSGTGEEGAYTYKYLFNGETVSGSLDTPGMTVTLTSEGSYSGEMYDRADSEKIFYFANNRFLNLYKLMLSKRYLYAYPFHPVYSFSGNVSSVNKLGGLDITFDPLDLDGIRDMARAYTPDLAVKSGKGYIQFTSDKDQTVDIRSLNGTSYSKVTMNAGDSKTINLPAGVYVVNNVKIIVK